MYQPLNGIQPATKELMARIAAAAPGELGYDRSIFPDKDGYERAVYSAAASTFFVYVDKVILPLGSSGYKSHVYVGFISESIREQNARYGLTALNSSSPMAVEYHVPETPNAKLKALMARELDDSGIPELQELSRQFVAELKGEIPVPALSAAAKSHLNDIRRVPVALLRRGPVTLTIC